MKDLNVTVVLRLLPTEEQSEYLHKCLEAKRIVRNFLDNKSHGSLDIKKLKNTVEDQHGNKWLYEINNKILLEEEWFYNNNNSFKVRGVEDSNIFWLAGTNINFIEPNIFRLPSGGRLANKELCNIKYEFLTEKHLPICGEDILYKRAYVYFQDDMWYLKFIMDKKSEGIGIDLGIKYLAVCSDRSIYENKSFDEFNEKNKEEYIKYINDVVDNIICKNPKFISYETLDLEEILEDDVKGEFFKILVGEFRKQVIDKTKNKSIKIYPVEKYFASSKICSVCGNKKEELDISERIYKCEFCKSEIDRDYNAALNLKMKGEKEYKKIKIEYESSKVVDRDIEEIVKNLKRNGFKNIILIPDNDEEFKSKICCKMIVDEKEHYVSKDKFDPDVEIKIYYK